MQQFAIVGCGKIAERHAENIIKKGLLSAACDIIPERAHKLAKKFNARPYYSLTDMLEQEHKLSAAAICTPNGLHALHSITCLQAGLHVLCEKPLCIKSDDGEAMIKAAQKAGKHLFVVKQNRYNPHVAEVKKMCIEGRLGNITSFQVNCFWNRPKEYYNDGWRGTKDLDGGTLFTQ